MFDKIWEAILSLGHELKFWFVVKHYEGAVVLRAGNIHRVRYAGMYWKWPLVEHIDSHYIKDDTILFPTQTLTTLDGKTVTVSGMVLYHVEDILPFLTELNQPLQAISDIGISIIADNIISNDLSYANSEEIIQKIGEDISEECKKWGITIEYFKFTGVASSRSLNISKQIESHL